VVDNGQARVAHCDFVGIGKTQGDGQVGFCEIFFDLVDFAADVPGRFADEWQKVTAQALRKCLILFREASGG